MMISIWEYDLKHFREVRSQNSTLLMQQAMSEPIFAGQFDKIQMPQHEQRVVQWTQLNRQEMDV